MPQQQPPRLILAANPMQETQIKADPSAVAHMAYRVEPGPKLMRLSQQMPGRGGLLYLGLDVIPPGGGLQFFLQQVVRECGARNYQGVVADLGRSCGELAAALDSTLHAKGLQFYVTECHRLYAPHAKFLFSTAISGGSLRIRLTDAVRALGPDRVVPALERVAEDFIPPARTGRGKALTPEELQQLRTKWKSSVFWSPELCCRYFSYFDQGQGHIVLFDDRETLRAKLRLIGELGIQECLCAWGDLQ